MIEIEDLCRIALETDKTLKNIRCANDFLKTTVTFKVPKLALMDLDMKLYRMEHGTEAGYQPCDNVECTMLGINFKIIPEETN